MFEFLKRFLGYSTQTEPVAPYKVEAPVVEATKCGCGRSTSGYCTGLHKLSDAAWAAKQDADNPMTRLAPEVEAAAVVAAAIPVVKAKKVAGTKPAKVATAKPAAMKVAKPKAPKAK